MGEQITGTEFASLLAGFGHTAFRLELQDAYAEPSEDALLAAFLRGERPDPATAPELRQWYEQVSAQTRDGKRIERVRVQQDPPTDYQRFERWVDPGNIQAGEIMRYMTRQRAFEVGLLPAAGTDDWWLLDSSRLLVMHFDTAEVGHRTGSELVTDPAAVVQACAWRDLAVHYAAIPQSPRAV
jgi:hypothetical protein